MAANEALKSLHTSLVDAQKGYDEAIKDAQAPEMASFFEKMSALHLRAHEEVDAILLERGEIPDESGSFMSMVHKTVISVRSAITGLDRSSLSSFADGEKRLVGLYDEAIAENRDDAATVAELQQSRSELLGMIAQMEAKAA
jgi:uncharacterized protein (TIGR02284 family)